MLFQVQAQKTAWKWYFEKYNGLNFSGDTVKFLSGCQFGLSESSSSICDKNGNLVFYSNGITLYNKFNAIVKNGTDLGYPINPNETTSRQGTLFLKHPDNDSLIFLFCTDYQGRNGGLVYSVININGNNDSGDVISKKVKLISPVNESVHAVNHQNGRDIWIVCHSHGGDVFYLYLLKKNGIITCPVTNKIGWPHSFDKLDAQTNIKFSPNGKMITHHETYWGNTEVFSFNSENGEMKDTIFFSRFIFVPGFDYSPNSKVLYLNKVDSITQVDLETKIERRIKGFDQSKVPEQIQLGPDGKIYGAIYQSKDLFVIDRPEKTGDSCKVIIKQNFLQNTNYTAMPNFNQSYFYTPSIDYKYEQNCINNSIQFFGIDSFKATTHIWQIKKKGKSAEGNYSSKNISHVFSDTGLYEVRYIASNGNRQDTVSKFIAIYPKIYSNFLGKDTAYAQGIAFSKNLSSPLNMHCVRWQDGSGATTFKADTAGVYICKITNQSFCEVTDTIVIRECINSLIQPNIKRSSDSLYTNQTSADSFVWFKNNVQYRISKEPFIKLTDTGSYRVEAAKKGYCNKSSNYFQIRKLGLSSYQLDDFNIQLFPNPSFEIIHIKADKNFLLQISDFTGKTIAIHENIDSISLPKGVYFFTFTIDAYKITEKVVVL
ncbi:MAG: hypothetical protein RLZ10_1572 [Bacteroidota bacterium]